VEQKKEKNARKFFILFTFKHNLKNLPNLSRQNINFPATVKFFNWITHLGLIYRTTHPPYFLSTWQGRFENLQTFAWPWPKTMYGVSTGSAFFKLCVFQIWICIYICIFIELIHFTYKYVKLFKSYKGLIYPCTLTARSVECACTLTARSDGCASAGVFDP